MKALIKNLIYMYKEKFEIKKAIYYEIKKYKDPRRVKNYSKIKLTKEQENSINNLYKKNYGKKIPYMWHKNFTAFTGNFDPRYIPESIYIAEFERFMNPYKEYNKVLEDKNILPLIAKRAGIKMPKTIFSCQSGVYYDREGKVCNEPIDYLYNIGEIFVKPSVDTGSGNGCKVLKIKNGVEINSGKTVEKILQEIGKNFICQERLKCHSSIAKIYPHSVNTFRIMTYRWKSEIIASPIIMRIGQGGANIDNAHAGGMFIAIENNGQLHDKAFTEFKDEYSEHPNTKVVFSNYKIEGVEEVINAAITMHQYMPQIGVINWDFTIDENMVPVLIEANNIGGSIWLFEMAHGKGAFCENTERILQWIRFMRTTKISERDKYYFGNIKQ